MNVRNRTLSKNVGQYPWGIKFVSCPQTPHPHNSNVLRRPVRGPCNFYVPWDRRLRYSIVDWQINGHRIHICIPLKVSCFTKKVKFHKKRKICKLFVRRVHLFFVQYFSIFTDVQRTNLSHGLRQKKIEFVATIAQLVRLGQILQI